MKMPCTQHDEQDSSEAPRISFRSSFNRAASGFRYANQQNLQSFAIQLPQNDSQHHPSAAIIPQAVSIHHLRNHNGTEEVTEQIRVSVEDTHISHGLSESDIVRVNLDEVSVGESYLTYYNDLRQPGSDARNSSTRNGSNGQSQLPTASTSTSSLLPTASSLITSHLSASSQSEQQSSGERPRIILVSDKEFCDRTQNGSDEREPNSRLLEMCQNLETRPLDDVEGNSKQSTTHVNTLHRPLNSPKKNQIHESHSELDIGSRVIELIPPCRNKQAGYIKDHLFNGSSFSGQQNSRNESYDVNVKIQHIDYENSYLNGYLCIAHLTKTHPTLTTFFEGEIISEQYPFLTRKWEATKDIDRAHWSKFDGFNNMYFEDSYNYDELKKSDYIYMRWKELFLVPDHTIKNVEGASYAGFYYVCYSKRTSQIKGYYFHIAEHFERFQSLNLELDCEERTSQVYEFR